MHIAVHTGLLKGLHLHSEGGTIVLIALVILGTSSSDDTGPTLEHGLRIHQIESLARNIERFGPDSPESNIVDYLRELEHCLFDLLHTSTCEKLKLVWKSTTRGIHVFMETVPPETRDHFSAFCHALLDEYSMYTDPASATLSTLPTIQEKHESPK